MRSFLPRGTLFVSVVLAGALLAAGGAQAQKRRPVTAPGQEVAPVPPPPPPPPPAEEAKGKADAKAAPAAASQPGAAEAAPAEPPAPLDFVDAAAIAAPAAPAAEVALPESPFKELRYTRDTGDAVYVMAVRPGEPKPGEPVEIFFRISEILAIPDPAYGDRRPLEGGRLQVRVSGPGMDRLYEIHELADAGTYGAHFSPREAGLYTLRVERTDTRIPQKVEFQLGVGAPTPGLAATAAPKRRTRNGVIEGVELVGVRGRDSDSIAGVMDELGRRWMELERLAGTPGAAEAAAAVREQVALVAGKMPTFPGADADEFDRLAAALVARTGSLGEGDRNAILGSMQQIRDEVCMRCHAKYRHRFADGVASWPDFSARENLQPPAPAAPRTGGRSRAPFGSR